MFSSLLRSKIDDDNTNEFQRSLTYLKRSRSARSCSIGSERDDDVKSKDQDSSSDDNGWKKVLKLTVGDDFASY